MATPPKRFRGTNWLPSITTGLSNPLGMIPWFREHQPGYYSHEHARDEIDEIARAGFNSLRVFPSFLAWAMDGPGYLGALKDIATHCLRNNLVITFVIWNSTCGNSACIDLDFTPRNAQLPVDALWREVRQLEQESQEAEFPPGEPGQYTLIPEPGPAVTALWPNVGPELRGLLSDYVRAVGRFFADDPIGRATLGSYDLYNEPDAIADLPSPGAVNLIQDTWSILEAAHRGGRPPEYTVGLAHGRNVETWFDALAGRVSQTYVSYHSDLLHIDGDLVTVGGLVERAGIPQVISEFWHTLPAQGQRGRLRDLVDRVLNANIGGQMWGYLQSNAFFNGDPVDGIVVPLLPAALTAPVDFRVEIPADHGATRFWTSRPFLDETGGFGTDAGETEPIR